MCEKTRRNAGVNQGSRHGAHGSQEIAAPFGTPLNYSSVAAPVTRASQRPGDPPRPCPVPCHVPPLAAPRRGRPPIGLIRDRAGPTNIGTWNGVHFKRRSESIAGNVGYAGFLQEKLTLNNFTIIFV